MNIFDLVGTRLDNDKIADAKSKLNSEDYLAIEDLSETLRENINEIAKGKSIMKKSFFGEVSADELIAKLGIFMIKNNLKIVKDEDGKFHFAIYNE